MSVMRHNGTSFIIAHNHPSGDPKPSMEDVRVTDNLRKAGKLMGIPLIDHIIIGNGEYYSFREEESKED
jgi:DNA repair protein RadC